MPELWGIDDEIEALRIRNAALRKDSFGRRTVIQLLIYVAITFLAIFLFHHIYMGPGAIKGGIKGAVAGAIGALIMIAWHRRRVRRLLPEALAGEGRCRKCGYDLKDAKSGMCPECGRDIGDRGVS